MPYRLVKLPWANHTFDFLWGGWGSQITRSSLEAFLESHLQSPEEAARISPFERQTKGQRREASP